MPADGFEWQEERFIPWRELTFRSDTSGGPGGQHANRSSTRITLLWQPADSTAFGAHEKERILRSLEVRLSGDGVLRLRSGAHRSAKKNKEECLDLLAKLIRQALKRRRPRIASRPTAASRRRRLDSKRRRSRTKETRRPPESE